MKSGSFFYTVFIIISSIVISSWLMFSTFSYNQTDNSMVISARAWSDFGAHIPMIRSFSLGGNLTRLLHGRAPEYPLFPGEPIRYHFLFYMGVGILERLGIRIDWALNILSIIGFSSMLIAIYSVAKKLFNDWRVGFLAWIFTLANGSLTFLKFFSSRPFSLQTFSDLWNFDEFLSFAPWGKGDISAFWTLNIYTNQRHLAFGVAIFFLFLYTLITLENQNTHQSKNNPQPATRNTRTKILFLLPWGIICGLLPYFYQPTLITLAIACIWFVIAIPKLRIPLLAMGLITSAIAMPQLILLSKGQSFFAVSIGYLMNKPISIVSFLSYWWQNIGGHLILIPIGFLISPVRAKKYLAPAFLFFAIGFCFQFSRELSANHKFFNLFLVMGSLFSSYAIIWIIDHINQIKFIPLRIPLFIIPFCIILFLTLSGVVDLMPIKNDRVMDLPDIKANRNAAWFLKNTPSDAVVMNMNLFDHPASIAGRKIFIGWPYFPWSLGYDTEGRHEVIEKILTNPSENPLCELLRGNNISYIALEDRNGDLNLPETDYQYYASHFKPVYVNPINNFTVYQTTDICKSETP
jgi:hypothetical protein